MGPPVKRSANPFSALQDDTALDFIHHGQGRLSHPTPDVQFSIPSRRVQAKNSKVPLREIPKALNASSQNAPKAIRQASQRRALAGLCSTCTLIFDQRRSEDWFGEWHEHHQSQSALDHAVDLGCRICERLKEASTKDSVALGTNHALKYRVELSQDLDYTVHIGYTTKTTYGYESIPNFPYLYDKIMLKPESKQSSFYTWASVFFLTSIPEIEQQLSKSDLRPSTASRETLDLCRHWLRTCRTQHTRCGHRRDESSFRPSRLIHIKRDKDGVRRARLDCRSVEAGIPAYLTLSHCWGLQKFFTLCTDNLEQLQRRIDINVLSKVFQDALLLTLELGFSYIWIDSLCIIQDSKEDWLSESSKMGDVYKHSSCNIAATGFSEGSRGFFIERDVERLNFPKVHAEWAGKWPYTEEPRRGYYYLVDQALWDNEVGSAPLNRRGWVLQERLLSPCVLHFGTQQVFWECFESYSCEIFPSKFPDGVHTPLSFKSLMFYEKTAEDARLKQATMDEDASWQRPKTKRKVQSNQLYAARNLPELYSAWHEIVVAYSISDLTKPEDKFLAISGVAKEIKRMSGDRYLAGLWERNILRDLLWMVYIQERVSMPMAYRAPSWSWASLNAPILYTWASNVGDEPETLHARFIDARLSNATGDDTGLLTDGCIRVSGRLVEVQCPSRRSWNLNATELDLDVHLDLASRYGEQTACGLKAQGSDVLEVSVGYDFEDHYLRNNPLYLFPVRTGVEPDTEWKVLVGLILTRTGRGRAEYMRLGLFTTNSPEAQQAIMTGASRPNSKIWGKGKDGQCTIILV